MGNWLCVYTLQRIERGIYHQKLAKFMINRAKVAISRSYSGKASD